jgi:RHS repeat-associated protein
MKREIIPYNSERRPYAQHLRLSGQYEDSESGLHYNTFRYYDPEMGRYLSRDPIGEAGGVNLYAFVGNNPVGRLDAEGLAFYAVGGTWESEEDKANPWEMRKDTREDPASMPSR